MYIMLYFHILTNFLVAYMIYLQVTATICEELSSDSILLVYISASGLVCAAGIILTICHVLRPFHLISSEIYAGKTDCSVASQKDFHGKSSNSSKANHASRKKDSSLSQPAADDTLNSNTNLRSYVCLGSQGTGGVFCCTSD